MTEKEKQWADVFFKGELGVQLDRLQRLIDDVKAEVRKHEIRLNDANRAIKILWEERGHGLADFRDD